MVVMVLLYIVFIEQSGRKSMLGIVSGIFGGLLICIDRIIDSILNTSILELFL